VVAKVVPAQHHFCCFCFTTERFIMISRPVFLVFPAYIIGLASIFASINLLPPVVGVSVAAILLLVMLAPATLLHPVIGNDDAWLHIILYCLCLCCAGAFAIVCIAKDFGPVAFDTGLTWLQIGFVVLQQAIYFGMHAFRK